ncbi:hypothetical protein HDZ31DRAFT_33179 [Schizophyllum fasciatum]
MSTPSRPTSMSSRQSSSRTLNDYQLGDSLGKGAFGQVYRALNWATGETVAIKEITLSNIPKAELGEIMSEIDLLKNLNHPNIVKYKGFVKEREYLYIILEFCENGSLHNIIKRFGKFPENLVAVYIAQVLEGLVYLHEQGVIHRDIKGANLLTNKDGTVKLADFGVASTATSTANNDAVVGSPYWMAPEVIEQSGATTASDIWSVGCVVIELLEGHPPYHTLDPMPALFRIVQDDCPPIPEGASPIVKDFLYHCFQKDCNLRVSAKKLLRHPWMVSTRRQMVDAPRESQGPGRPLSNYNYDEAVLKVQEWNEALKSPSRPSKHPSKSKPSASPAMDIQPLRLPVSTSAGSAGSGWKKIQPVFVPPPEEQTDNWDDDFEEGISLTKLQAPVRLPNKDANSVRAALDKSTSEEERTDGDDNAQTIRPHWSPSSGPVPLAKAPASEMNAIIEDYSDLAEDDDLEGKVADFKMKNSFRRGLFHPDDIKVLGLNSAGPSAPLSAPLFSDSPPRRSPRPSPIMLPTGKIAPSPATAQPRHARSSSFAGNLGEMRTSSMGQAEARKILNQQEFGKYAEDDDEDYDDVFGKPNGTMAGPEGQTLQLNTRLSNKSWLGDEASDEEDPFAEIDEGFAEDDLETNLQRDKYARLTSQVNQLIDELTPSAPDFQLKEACDQLLAIVSEAPEMQVQLVSSHGMLAILEVLEGRCSRDVIMRLLQIINTLVQSDIGFLESFCLIGGIPVMMGFTSKKYSSDCRLQASNFVRLLCHTSVLTLQMFISCRGLKVLVDLLDEDYTEQADLVVHALNGICSVFELQSPTTKNDFCRMFIREGLLDPLSAALLNVMASQGESSMEMKMKIIQILQVFAQVSQSDIHVRNALGTRKVIRRLLRACELLEPECLAQMLKAIKHLSMNPTLLEVLQNANAIEILVRILDEQSTGPHGTEISNHIFQTCYNLCRLNKSRQEEAAQAGIIPCLKRVIETRSPLKQFALPILCDLASAGKSCRSLLWQHDALSMYLRLLDDPYFQVSALESILSWLQDETARVEDKLLEFTSVELLVKCFVSAKANSFENLLDPFLKLIRMSTPLTLSIAKVPAFHTSIRERLMGRRAKAVVRVNLLRVLRTVVEVHPNRVMLVEKYGLSEIVGRLAKEDPAVLVRKLAKEIAPTLQPGLARRRLKAKPKVKGPTDAPNTPKSAIAPKRMRRSASEANASPYGSIAPNRHPASPTITSTMGRSGSVGSPLLMGAMTNGSPRGTLGSSYAGSINGSYLLNGAYMNGSMNGSYANGDTSTARHGTAGRRSRNKLGDIAWESPRQ